MRERTYLTLMHHPVLDREGLIVSSAVTPLDMHDFSRLARTYGLAGVFVQTNLPRQEALVGRLIEHWVRGVGSKMNPNRCEALSILDVAPSLDEVAARVERAWGAPPLLVATSARADGRRVGYEEARRRARDEERPILLLFGTSWGIAPEVMQRCDFVLEPIGSPGGYNHLSVRSAASITVDRLFG